VRFKYKTQGYADYNEYSIHRVRETIRRNLIKNEDFALELNLGFAHQFEYTLSIKRFNYENKLNVVLFLRMISNYVKIVQKNVTKAADTW